MFESEISTEQTISLFIDILMIELKLAVNKKQLEILIILI